MADPFLHMPRDWAHITLEENPSDEYIMSVDSGGTPSTRDEDNWDGDIPWITPKEITDLRDTIYVSKTERYITSKGLSNSGTKLLPVNTVLLSKRAPVGAVAINATQMATNQGFLCFQAGSKLRPLYLAYWLKTNLKYLSMVANGSTYPELYKSDLFEFNMAVPPLELQDKIIELIGAIRFIKLSGLPREQLISSVEDLIDAQNKFRRLNAIEELFIPLLLSGHVDLNKIDMKKIKHYE